MYTVTLYCYGPARAVEREGFLEDLKKIINARALNNLIVCGDFNMIYDNEMDIIAGAPHSKREAESFSNFQIIGARRYLENYEWQPQGIYMVS